MISLVLPTTGKGKSIPLQAWSGQEGSRKLRFPDFMTTAQDGSKVVSLTHRPPLPTTGIISNKLHGSLKRLNLRPAVCILMQKQ